MLIEDGNSFKKITSEADKNERVCGFSVKNEWNGLTFCYNNIDKSAKYFDRTGKILFNEDVNDNKLNNLYKNDKKGHLKTLNPMLRLSDYNLKKGDGMYPSESISILIQYSNVIAVTPSEPNQKLNFLEGQKCNTEKDYAVFLLSVLEGKHLIFGVCELDENKILDRSGTVHIFESTPLKTDQ